MTDTQLFLDPDTQLVTVEDASPTVSVRWDKAVQQAVLNSKVGPTIGSRAYAIVHTAIFDAWSAYSLEAVSTQTGDDLQRPVSEWTIANKTAAMSFAAYRVLLELFPEDAAIFNDVMASLDLDINNNTTDTTTAAGIGNVSAEALMAFRRADGSNQENSYADTTGYAPVNADANSVIDIQLWTPESVPIDAIDAAIDPPDVLPKQQEFLTPQWSVVTPFALASPGSIRPVAPEPFLLVDATVDLENGTITPAGETEARPITADMVGLAGEPGKLINQAFIDQAERVVTASATLTDEEKLIAEFWEDGAGTSFPPGTWQTFGQFVSARDGNSLDEDVLLFFSLANAAFDAGIATWEAKVFYDYVRPIRAIRELGKLGLLNNGATGTDEITGETGFVIEAWGGPGQGTKTILADNFLTYQTPGSDVSPPFAEYTSGHSSFSAAGAEILKLFTESDDFGAAVTFEAGASRFENTVTPVETVTLSWDTFSEAAEEAGLSRIYGGIHFDDGDINGRATGRQAAAEVWNKTQALSSGADVFVLNFQADRFSLDAEIGFFIVDDESGAIDSLSPTDEGYLTAALARSSVLFSALPKDAAFKSSMVPSSSRSLLEGTFLRFFSISGSTVDSFLHDGSGQVSLTDIEQVDQTTGLEMPITGLNVRATPSPSTAAAIGTGLQGSTQSEVLDLTALDAETTVIFSVQSEADFDNVVGFYVIDDLTGRVNDSMGNSFSPEDTTNYIQAALENRIADISLSVDRSVDSGRSTTFSTTLEAGQIIAPFLLVDGSIDALLDSDASNDPAIYFPFIGANSDGADHVRLFGDNTFGFEDMPEGGDQDFDDMIVQVEFA